MKNKDFEKLFFSKTRDFLDEYLTKQCSRSPHTVKAYRDALTVFRKYVSVQGCPLKHLVFRTARETFFSDLWSICRKKVMQNPPVISVWRL